MEGLGDLGVRVGLRRETLAEPCKIKGKSTSIGQYVGLVHALIDSIDVLGELIEGTVDEVRSVRQALDSVIH